MATKPKKTQPDYVTFAEYLRRKNAAMQEADPTAPKLYRRSLQHAVDTEGINAYKFGNCMFIDWEESKGYVFRTHYRSPKKDLVAGK